MIKLEGEMMWQCSALFIKQLNFFKVGSEGNNIEKPEVVYYYSSHMGVVDLKVQLFGCVIWEFKKFED